MLLRFQFSNCLSIYSTQFLSFTASALKDNSEGLITSPALPQHKILPAVLIYGANASGKSNVLSALNFMKTAVLFSHTRESSKPSVPRRPFALAKAASDEPSHFDLDFIAGGIRYHYGFKATNREFVREWLYSYPRGRQVELFERTSSREIEFKRALRGKNRLLADLMRPDSLFLSVAAQNNHEQLTDIRNAIADIAFDNNLSVGGAAVSGAFGEGGLDKRTINFLREVGTGVEDYKAIEEEETEAMRRFQAEILSLAQKHFSAPETKIEVSDKSFKIELAHRALDNDLVYFDLSWESSGTRRLLMLLAAVFRALDSGSVLVIDEIDASLHTQICESIIALFSDPETNKNGAQLLATTHDTNLMRSYTLRRDQLWFTEKNRDGETSIYPLTDLHTRSTDNIEKGYLQGRFGAIPFSGSTRFLLRGLGRYE